MLADSHNVSSPYSAGARTGRFVVPRHVSRPEHSPAASASRLMWPRIISGQMNHPQRGETPTISTGRPTSRSSYHHSRLGSVLIVRSLAGRPKTSLSRRGSLGAPCSDTSAAQGLVAARNGRFAERSASQRSWSLIGGQRSTSATRRSRTFARNSSCSQRCPSPIRGLRSTCPRRLWVQTTFPIFRFLSFERSWSFVYRTRRRTMLLRSSLRS